MTSEKEGYLIVTTVSFRDPVMMRGRRAHFLAPLSGLWLVLLNREGPVLQGMLPGQARYRPAKRYKHYRASITRKYGTPATRVGS
jgi:hypothetical protein